MLPHGGGVTPVAQTVDTDLNQHTRREYTDMEAAELIRQLRLGKKIPSMSPEQSIDIMYELFAPADLHIAAAKGYDKTGQRVPLDGTGDMEVVREAGDAWHELNMRVKINREVAMVIAEHAAGRLTWCPEHVQKLIMPYPAKSCDKVLEAQDDLAGLVGLDAEAAGLDAAGVISDEGSADEGADESTDEGASDSEAADLMAHDEPVSDGEAADTAAVAPVTDEPIASATNQQAVAEVLATNKQMAVLASALQGLKDTGCIGAAILIQNQMNKMAKTLRLLQREDPAVANAFSQIQDIEYREEIKQKQLMDTQISTQKALQKVKRDLEDAKSELKKRKAAIMDVEKLVEAQQAMQNFSSQQLGEGGRKGGAAACKKNRFLVMDRLSRLGQGLKPQQANDFSFFKEAWDNHMSVEHDTQWGSLFAGLMQKVMDDITRGTTNAFSVFVFNETRRVLSEVARLQVPGRA